MLLHDACREMLRINLRIRSECTKRHYRTCLKHFAEYLDTEPEIQHLTDDHHSGYARWLLDRGLAEVTVNQRLHYMRALWRFCCRRGYLTIWPTSSDIVEPERQPESWSEDDLARLWGAFDKVPGSFCGIRKSYWWRAFHEVIYFTGERKSAVLAARWTWLRGDRLSVPAKHRKGGRKSRSYWLPDRVLRALDAIRHPPRELIFPRPSGDQPFYNQYHRLLRIAGIDGPRRGPQQMRRTHASFLARAGGDPTKSLGHSTSRITNLYYLDPTIAEREPANSLLPDPPHPPGSPD